MQFAEPFQIYFIIEVLYCGTLSAALGGLYLVNTSFLVLTKHK
jgi:hypothetical protein